MNAEMDHLIRQLKETNERLRRISNELHQMNVTLERYRLSKSQNNSIPDLESYFEDDLK